LQPATFLSQTSSSLWFNIDKPQPDRQPIKKELSTHKSMSLSSTLSNRLSCILRPTVPKEMQGECGFPVLDRINPHVTFTRRTYISSIKRFAVIALCETHGYLPIPALDHHRRKGKQEAFEKCWAHSPLRTAARPFNRCRY